MTDKNEREEIKKPGDLPASSSGDSFSGAESPVFGNLTGSSPAQTPGTSASDEVDPAYEKTVIAKVPQVPNRSPGSGLRPTQAETKAAEHAKAKAAAERVKTEERRGASTKTVAPIRPEDSIPLRLATVMMVILLITGATVYVEMPLLAGFLLMWLAMIGTLLSYIYRAKRPGWVGIFPTIGAFLLVAYMVNVCLAQLNLGQINFLSTFTQVLAGLLALHCFDLRTRADFSINALIGLGLLVCTSGSANDLLFFICILGYISSVSLILYFDGVSRSRDVGPSRPIGEGRPASLPKPNRRQARAATSTILIPVLSLPLLTLLMFFFMPRSSSLINWVLENAIRPYVAVSPSERTKGYSGGAGTGAKPTKRGSGGTANGGVGGAGGSGGTGGQGSPSQAVNPLDKRTSGKAPKGVGGNAAGQTAPYKEGVSSKNDEPQNVLPQSEATEDVILRLTTPRPGYLRRVSFDKYDGSNWSRAEQLEEVEFLLLDNQFPVGNANVFGIPRNCPIVEVPQHITVDKPLTGGTLPAMWVPQQLEGPFKTVAVQSDGTIKPDTKIEPGMTYFALSYVPVYRLGALTSQPVKTHSDFKASLFLPPVAEMEAAEKALIERYLQLPDQLPSRVKSKAKKIAGEGNWFVKAQRISEYLHNKKAFKYKSKNIYRVSGGDFVDNFLFKTKEGNCVDYASSFVIMARAAGIPARLVGGYLPGKYNQRTGFYEIKVKDGHAWAEIYMPNWSWIAFDPVPGGKLPETQKDESLFSKLADMGLANPFGGAFQGSSGAGLGHGITGSKMSKQLKDEQRKKENKPPIEEDDEFDVLKRLTKVRWEPIAIAFIVLGSGALVLILLQRQRKKDYVAIPDDARKSTLLFFQVVRDLRKYKIVRLPADTPLDLHARVLEGFESHRKEGKYVHPELEPLVSDFIEIYTLERFGRQEARIAELERMSEKIKKLVSASK